MRAEVGFLTRNILIQGEMEDTCYGQYQCQFFSFDTLGGHMKILRNFSSGVSGVELKNMGQQILGSYPVPFHLAEDVDERGGCEHPITWLSPRCVAMHGTHCLLGCQQIDCKSKQQSNRECSSWCSGWFVYWKRSKDNESQC